MSKTTLDRLRVIFLLMLLASCVMLVYLLALVLGANRESASGLSTIRLAAIFALVCAIGMLAWVQWALQGERIPQALERLMKGGSFYCYLWGSVGLGVVLLNYFLWPAYR